MATYTPNEQLKGVLNTTLSVLNTGAHETDILFPSSTVPSNEYWKVRIESVSTKRDNFEGGTIYFWILQPGSSGRPEYKHSLGSLSFGFVGVGTPVSIGFLDVEHFMHPGWSIGFDFIGDDIILDAQIDLTIFKYTIF